MQPFEKFFKCIRLTQEEWDFYWKWDRDFWKKYNFQYLYLPNWPLRRKIAAALHSLAVKKLVNEKNKKEAIKHHLKACSYYPSIAFGRPTFRKKAGLPILKYNKQ